MSGPFIIISTWEIKDGKLEELKRFQRELSRIVEEKEPQLIAFNAFLNEEGTEMTSIQVHPDAASMDFHLKVIREHLGDAMSSVADFAEPKTWSTTGRLPRVCKRVSRVVAAILSPSPFTWAGSLAPLRADEFHPPHGRNPKRLNTMGFWMNCYSRAV